jgi:hypothetical protein
MPDTSQREVAEAAFQRDQRREQEINDALKQEATRREAAVKNMHRQGRCGWNGRNTQAFESCPPH